MIEMDEFTIKAMNNMLDSDTKILSKFIRKSTTVVRYDYIIEVDYRGSVLYIGTVYSKEMECGVDNIINNIKENIKSFEKLTKTKFKQNHENYIRVSANLKLQKEMKEIMPIMYVKKVNEILNEKYQTMIQEDNYKKGFVKLYDYFINDYIEYCIKEKEEFFWE